MARRRNPVVQWILTTLCLLFAKTTAYLPLSVCRKVGRFAGLLAYACVPRVRKVTLSNLDLAYGDALTASEKRKIARGAAQNVGIVGAEFSHMPQLTKETIPLWVAIDGLDNLPRDRGAFIIGAHIGNWEWMASVLAINGYKVAEVVRPLDDPRLNDYVDTIRRSCGVVTIPKDGSGQEIVRLLKEGWIVGILVDQSMRESAIPVTFFGKRCWSTVGPAIAASRAKISLHSVAMSRDATDRYTFHIAPALDLELTGNLREDFATLTQRSQDEIEVFVRKTPEQWLWLHRRWKERTKLDQEWAARVAKKSGV